MDLIVCGDALWISCGTWIAFWNGMIGALASAVLAAGVALLVVSLANHHQQGLADAALEEQQRLASLALQEQRDLALDALTEQRRLAANASRDQRFQYQRELLEQRSSMALQLEAQRAEASKGRYFAATADLVTAVEACANTFRRGGDIEDAFVQMESARVRMFFDSDSPGLMDELESWTYLIWELTKQAAIEWKHPTAERLPLQTLTAATSLMTTSLTQWHSASASQQEEMLGQLRETRQWAGDPSGDYRELLTPDPSA
ncbi:hypothetical protein [Arthrobacter sp. I3]|uniref:hypothetical protein n=1 Tax=Arthrobacter sp. I3 TaxID=218158 RepID=UPI00048701D6|nr:hypothetical protein [Arthrobacter sp. I3]